MSTNAEYAEMPIVKLRVEALARNQRCLERKLSEQFKLNWIPCFYYPWIPECAEVHCKVAVKASAWNLCCLKPMYYDPLKKS